MWCVVKMVGLYIRIINKLLNKKYSHYLKNKIIRREKVYFSRHSNLFFHCTFNKCWIDFKTAGSNKRIEYLISNNLYCCNIVAKSVPKWQLRWCFFGHWFFNYLHNKFLKMLRSSFTLILAIICTSRVLPWFSCG